MTTRCHSNKVSDSPMESAILGHSNMGGVGAVSIRDLNHEPQGNRRRRREQEHLDRKQDHNSNNNKVGQNRTNRRSRRGAIWTCRAHQHLWCSRKIRCLQMRMSNWPPNPTNGHTLTSPLQEGKWKPSGECILAKPTKMSSSFYASMRAKTKNHVEHTMNRWSHCPMPMRW